ncbi:hypothetical protein CC1G_04613 [Coprinopsis cinerea okayama7|uniref:Uncharacterized protein n=1 Tax=Coprinopsis cinerea (strain Okayama-7 / 130 / ATCC MYA-4618 / FGSC 9003) TaxID=240176 RepID=A8N535_COPC7|nr:hypothetical protein CC1G_04613 [Coprinopsis cinerea okayama7\|eukprot:XP_001829924.2 hypothetical protein CC1G_04613 [Coprinopsis cinerea okayama7\
MPANTSPRLPPELLELLIHPYVNDRPMLAQLSLVGRDWYPITRVHLFRTIQIPIRYPPGVLEQRSLELLQLFRVRPSLPQFVREVELLVNVNHESPIMDADQGLKDLSALFAMIGSPKAISLQPSTDYKPSWTSGFDFSKGFVDAFFHLVSTPTVEKVKIWKVMDFPLSRLLSIPTLRHLDLTRVDGYFDSLPDKALPPCNTDSGELVHFTTNDCHYPLPHLVRHVQSPFAALRLDRLRHLTFNVNWLSRNDWIETWDQFTSLFSSTLESLAITHCGHLETTYSRWASFCSSAHISPMAFLDIAVFPNLKKLTFYCSYSYAHYTKARDCPINGMSASLDRFSRMPNQLEEVAIEDKAFLEPDFEMRPSDLAMRWLAAFDKLPPPAGNTLHHRYKWHQALTIHLLPTRAHTPHLPLSIYPSSAHLQYAPPTMPKLDGAYAAFQDKVCEFGGGVGEEG